MKITKNKYFQLALAIQGKQIYSIQYKIVSISSQKLWQI